MLPKPLNRNPQNVWRCSDERTPPRNHHHFRNKENTLSIDVEFFPELNLQDDAFSGLAHLVCTALEAINKEAERHVG